MNLLYLTTAIKDEDYVAALNGGYRVGNPSNQNFHDKMIKALRHYDSVQVLSLVPNPQGDLRFINSDNYDYINCVSPLFDRLGERRRQLFSAGEKAIAKGVDAILFDSLSASLGSVAIRLSRKHRIPAIAIVTDNPENLAKAPYFYVSSVEKHLSSAEGVLALSEGLLNALHLEKKPHFLFPGLVEKSQNQRRLFPDKSYFYFGGALLARYGVLNLLGAYLETKPNYDLLIAGHQTPDDAFEALQKKNPRIRFLGQLSKEENYDLEAHGALLINPRPFDTRLDQQSVPSKLLEYLESGSPILSTPHTELQKEFPDDINWLTGSDEKALSDFLKAHLDKEGHLTAIKENKVQAKIYSLYGLEAIGQKIHDFVQSLKTSIN
jgi:glycosyltransferase involved in cell wall biosynthesis